jgi:fructose-bisphosphate aldolase, class I
MFESTLNQTTADG